MTYDIKETNFERQHLLAEQLDPLSLDALRNITLPEAQNPRILDLGCGIGNTTNMLNGRFPGAHITGVDGDKLLIRAATERNADKHPNLDFLTGDARHLPFPDNCFHLVFSRYILEFIPEPLSALNEMKRVCKPGGILFCQDPDVNFVQSYPESWAYPKFVELANRLFPDATIGRKRPHYFNKAGIQHIQYRAQAGLADGKASLKRLYTLTALAMKDGLLDKGLLQSDEFDKWVAELRRMEEDPEAVLLKFPTIAIWGTKPVGQNGVAQNSIKQNGIAQNGNAQK